MMLFRDRDSGFLAGVLLVGIIVLLTACSTLAPASTVASQPVPTPAVVVSTPTHLLASPTVRIPTPSVAGTTPTAVLPTPVPTPNVAPGDQDVAERASVSVSGGEKDTQYAIDGKLTTLWSAGGPAPQSITLTLDHAYLVDSIQLIVAQNPAGQTSHEIWLGDPSGKLTLYKKLVNVWTADGQPLTIPIQPARVVDRILIRTDSSPSFVAWHEIRVFGQLPPATGVTTSSGPNPTPVVVNWPRLAVVGNFDQPTQVTNAGDGSGRTFVVERAGLVRIVEDGVPIAKPFLDITDRVKCCDSEQGFFSIAFPPDFAQKQYFYVDYTSKTRGPIGDVVVARYHVSSDPNLADANSEQVLLTVPKENPAHNGGQLAFGPKDGYLYIGVGDGGLENDPTNEAQSLSSLKGKILRIDTESGATPYAIPPTNPFLHTPGARPEIWAYGLRNPWRFSFDSQNGDLYIGDVGENNQEEVDFIPASSPGGENFGWHIMEGTHCYLAANCDERGLTMPIEEYTHTDGNCAIIGGTVYRGKAYPDMQGIYFYADLCSGRIWGLKQVGDQWENNLLIQEPFQITSIGTDEAGNLYVSDFKDGTIFRITEPPATGAASS